MRFLKLAFIFPLVVLGCTSDRRAQAERDSLDYASECGPCACDDSECYDSLQAENRVNALMAAPALKVTSLAAAAQSYSADTSLYKVSYVLSKPLIAGDTVYVRLIRDSSGVSLFNILKKSRAQRDTLDYKIPKVFGRIATYFARVQVVRKGNIIVAKATPKWSTNFATPVDTTPPAIDSVLVDSALAILLKPENPKITEDDWKAKGVFFQDSLGNLYDSLRNKLSFKCPGGGTRCPGIQFCTFVVFGDSNIVMRVADKGKPPCEAEYAKFPVTRTADVRPTQQAKADLMCINYRIEPPEGGSIVSESCGNPALRDQTKVWHEAEILVPQLPSLARQASGWEYYLDHQMPTAVAEAILAEVRSR